MDAPSTIAKTLRILKFGVVIGMTGLLIANMLEHFVGQNAAICDIKDDLNDVKVKVGDLDDKINQLIQNGTNDVLNEIKELFADQNRIIINNIPSLDYIKKLLKDALSQYDADKTGRTDFALESSGGAIVSIRSTENYVRGAPTLTLFGIPLCSGSNSPRTIIQPSTLPGECWAFKGSSGTAVIKLLGRVVVTGVSLEHIPASISPTGELKTAPKEFSIWGLTSEVDNEGAFLGQFIYNISGPSVQYFPVNNCYKSYNYVEFKVISNHGNPEYTCVYRIRVHGKLDGPRL
ncbi:SUN domain-containing protein 1-like [Chrysoperla carnea]|uniref:SUN domain-containing protein 1-like n=1 Tax=Chrysoperla carnea TaxID=189513 RepID=UPI001D07A8DE|nr:SUN domain-containing protein 1-like [Chrysoperla carnea]